jgi:hypothetical protein
MNIFHLHEQQKFVEENGLATRKKNKIFQTADRVIIQLLGNLLTNAKLISTKCICDKDNIVKKM